MVQPSPPPPSSEPPAPAPSRPGPGLVARAVTALVSLSIARPLAVLTLALLVSLGCGIFAAGSLAINTDTQDFVSADEPFVRDHQIFETLFPQLAQTSVIVVSADEPARARAAAAALSDRLRAREDLVADVFVPEADPFYERNAFLFLGEDRLAEVLDRLAEAQPALAVLAQEPDLRGIQHFIDLARTAYEAGGPLPPLVGDLMRALADEAVAVGAGAPPGSPWFDRLLAREIGSSDRLVIVQGHLDFDRPLPGQRLIELIRESAEALDLTPETGVEIRLTGRVPLETEELQSARDSAALAGVLSLVLLTLLMLVGVRSVRIILSTVAALFAGLAWTLAFAAVTVGAFNVLSVAFAVLFIGIGVDFMIHYVLRAQEEAAARPLAEALTAAAEGVGAPVLLCAVTTAIGFLAFLPTDYRALGELGLISAGGVFFAVLATFTVIPALLKLFGMAWAPVTARRLSGGVSALVARIAERPRLVLVPMGILTAGAVWLATGIAFDFSSLALKDPNSESVRTLRYLQEKGIATDFSIRVLADSFEAAGDLEARLRTLPSVREVVGTGVLVPADQADKRAQLEDALFFLWPALVPAQDGAGPPLDAAQRKAILQSLSRSLREVPQPAEPARRDFFIEAHRLAAALSAILDDPDKAVTFEERLVSGLDARLDWLREALQPGEITLADVPEDLRRRFMTGDGRLLITVLPAEDISDLEAARRFIADVRSIAPGATGRPVAEAGVGAVVERSLFEAFGLAAAAIFVLLLISLRSVVDSLLVMTPLLAAAALTVASAVLLGIDFNFANVILLPLIFGLGVDAGIHMVTRYREGHSVSGVMGSSTPRAIVLSVLTTLCSFGSLMLSSHYGIKSMGIMLSIAAVWLLVCTLLILPALLTVSPPDHAFWRRRLLKS
ncbi:MAG: MMPL family transporter [Alphaproteobacteria bacterium]|nr:MMPL family transporter [Alphaproteobacteria bacterium]